MHKTSWYVYTILTGVMMGYALYSSIKIKLEGDILVVIVHSKFHKNLFITFRAIPITYRLHTHRWKHNLL